MRFLVVLILLIFLLGCKSSKNTTITDVTQTETVKESNEVKKGISAKISTDQFSSDAFKITRFEPIYLNIGGKDTVILKEVVYEQINTNITKEENTKIDTTSTQNNKNNQSQFIDNSSKETEFEGYDIIKSIIGGVVYVITGPFRWVLWIVAVLLIIPIFRFIKNKLIRKQS